MSILKAVFESESIKAYNEENKGLVAGANQLILKSTISKIKQIISENYYEFVGEDLQETFENISEFTSLLLYYNIQEAREILTMDGLSDNDKLKLISEADLNGNAVGLQVMLTKLKSSLEGVTGGARQAILKQIEDVKGKMKEFGVDADTAIEKAARIKNNLASTPLKDTIKDTAKGVYDKISENPKMALAGAGIAAGALAANRYLKARKSKS